DDDGGGGAAVEGEREGETEPARPLSAAPPRRRSRGRSLASPSGVRRRTRAGGHRPGTETTPPRTMPPRTTPPRTTPGAGHPGVPRTGRTRPHVPATPVTGREDARPEGAGPGEGGSHGGRERS
ncbi:DUF4192 domain-containing protein, partial [Streptomyces sp. SID5926]|nr:DUF4192 domain-containing protein [Streptomyces sp. SID5926]